VSRRHLLATGVASATLAAIGKLRAAETTGKRPNILWLVSEDNNSYIGAYGDRLAHTPTIDALAAQGVLLQRVLQRVTRATTARERRHLEH